nr:visual system homeobox 1-like [Anser cygnoides]
MRLAAYHTSFAADQDRALNTNTSLKLTNGIDDSEEKTRGKHVRGRQQQHGPQRQARRPPLRLDPSPGRERSPLALAPLFPAPLAPFPSGEAAHSPHGPGSPRSGHRPPQLRHTGVAAAPCASSTHWLRGAAAASRRPAAAASAAAAAAILCVGCLPAPLRLACLPAPPRRCRPPLPAPGPPGRPPGRHRAWLAAEEGPSFSFLCCRIRLIHHRPQQIKRYEVKGTQKALLHHTTTKVYQIQKLEMITGCFPKCYTRNVNLTEVISILFRHRSQHEKLK